MSTFEQRHANNKHGLSDARPCVLPLLKRVFLESYRIDTVELGRFVPASVVKEAFDGKPMGLRHNASTCNSLSHDSQECGITLSKGVSHSDQESSMEMETDGNSWKQEVHTFLEMIPFL